MALPKTLFVGRAPVMFDNSISYQYMLLWRHQRHARPVLAVVVVVVVVVMTVKVPASSSPKIKFLRPPLTASRLRWRCLLRCDCWTMGASDRRKSRRLGHP
jgi:hypothetical protein